MDRINEFETPTARFDGTFIGSRSLQQKVGSDNRFKSFFGDTVVFALTDDVKSRLSACIDLLYDKVPQCFCERLSAQTFHVTLHDLANAQTASAIAEEMFFNELAIAEGRAKISELCCERITLKSKNIFNMVNTSLCLGLYPATERDHAAISSLYSFFDGVKKLGYPFTPHITLAYYNSCGFDENSARSLENVVARLNGSIDITVGLGDLIYQKFTDMNTYVDIMNLSATR